MTLTAEAPAASPAPGRSRGLLLPAVLVLVVAVAALLVVFVRQSSPRPAGSALRERLDRVALPAGITADGDSFGDAGTFVPGGQCFDSCPSGSRYYASTLPPDAMRDAMARALRDAGFRVEERSCANGCVLRGPDGVVGASSYELTIGDGTYDGWATIGVRAGGQPGMEILLGVRG